MVFIFCVGRKVIQWCSMMAYLCSLLLVAIHTVTSGATPLYCSDVQSPASGNGHNTDLSQVTTLQYCIIDNCTIMRIDTGQQLDIVYTTESLLMVTPKDGHTSIVIAKIDDELPCLEYHNGSDDRQYTVHVIIVPLVMMVSICTIIIHLLFKDLRTSLFGKLLMLYNLAVFITAGGNCLLQITHYWINANSQILCHTATILTILGVSGVELFATNILTHSAYLMYRCYHLKSEISKKRLNYLFRCYTAYAAFTLVLVFFATIAYDWRTGNGKYTIMSNGYCIILDHPSYDTLAISSSVAAFNKIPQLAMFSAYLVYFYKFNKNVHAAQVTLSYSRKLFRLATAMGSTVGLSTFIFALLVFIPEYSQIIIIITSTIFLIQQVVIFASLIFTKKMSTLCKAYFSRD